ncbi:hypothetical protein BGZ95_003953 [Linnemannia exigua]|uniref:Uncharacterized protein n=1 Tax=Linnemannia exigua TaxID=604196 RepID=A0AAD4H2E8_9FUNG|nr:hypothetical protein BGZ95_003953 [Linnemannia exigua]
MSLDATPSSFPSQPPPPPPPPIKSKSCEKRSRSSKPKVFCCCFPVASGAWILSLSLVIPSVALVLGLNIANLQGVIKFNTPLHAKIFYSVIYSLYATIGLAIGLALNRIVSANRRLRILIILYWILIATTVIEGIYFGVMIAKNKTKFITNCGVDGPLLATAGSPPPTTIVSPVGSPGNGTVAAEGGPRAGRPVNCHKTGAMIGAVYIAGPGGWIILHIAWILMVALYAKALRRHHAADEEHGPVMMAPLTGHGHDLNRPFTKSGLSRSISNQQLEDSKKGGAAAGNIEPVSGFHSHQSHPFQLVNSSRRSSSGGLGAMFRNMRPWSPSSNSSTVQDSSNNTSTVNTKAMMHVIDEDDVDTQEERGRTRVRCQQGRNSNTSIIITINKANGDQDSDSSDDDNDDNANNRLTRLGTSSTDGSLSSRTDIPADGKGWWIRQIEGKRRGEICPCTLDPRDSRDFGPCWCGKERRVSSVQSQSSSSAIALTAATAQGSGSGSGSGSTSSAPMALTKAQQQ